MNDDIENIFVKMEALPDGSLKGKIVGNGTSVQIAELKAGFALEEPTVHRLIQVTKTVVEDGEAAQATNGIDALITLWDVGYVEALRTIGEIQVMSTVLGMVEDGETTGNETLRVTNEARVSKMLSIGVVQGNALAKGGDVAALSAGIYDALPETRLEEAFDVILAHVEPGETVSENDKCSIILSFDRFCPFGFLFSSRITDERTN